MKKNSKKNEEKLPNLSEFLPTFEGHREIAEHLTAILDNPKTPELLYNAIVDAITDLSEKARAYNFTDSPEFISYVLAAYDCGVNQRRRAK